MTKNTRPPLTGRKPPGHILVKSRGKQLADLVKEAIDAVDACTDETQLEALRRVRDIRVSNYRRYYRLT